MEEYTILLADDDYTTQAMLVSVLEEWNYRVLVVENGRAAYERIVAGDVAVALLDWDMPGYSGIDICRRIVAQDLHSPVYRIVLTAKGGSSNISLGLDAGAHDYIVKPFDPVVLKSRIRTGIRFFNLENSLYEKNKSLRLYANKMESLARERAEQLVHADRLSTLGMLTAGVAHEINNPNTFISGNLRILQDLWPTMEDIIKSYDCSKADAGDTERLDFIREEVPGILQGIGEGVRRISKIVDGLKLYARKEKMQKETVSLQKILQDVFTMLHNRIKNITLKTFCDEDFTIYGDYQRLEQVCINLVVNALDEVEEKGKEGIIEISCHGSKTNGILTITDNGRGVPPDTQDAIFSPFFTTKDPGKGTGLGLSICRSIVEEHGGELVLDADYKEGARFLITLPDTTEE
jgi:signal transduction histidine kinase